MTATERTEGTGMVRRKTDQEKDAAAMAKLLRFADANGAFASYIEVDSSHEQNNRRFYVCGGDVPRGVVQECSRATGAMKPEDWRRARRFIAALDRP